MTRQQQFRSGHGVRRRASLASALAACLATFSLLGLAPPSAGPDRPAADPAPIPVFVSTVDRIVVPPPPAPIHRATADTDAPEPRTVEEATAPDPETSHPESMELSGPPARAIAGEEFVVYDDPPRPRRMVTAKYPEIARAGGLEGWVLCEIHIDAAGRVTDVRILDGSSEMFHAAARAALLASTFTPAQQSGRPVACVVVQRIEFSLDG